jgi:hypothetical protein
MNLLHGARAKACDEMDQKPPTRQIRVRSPLRASTEQLPTRISERAWNAVASSARSRRLPLPQLNLTSG